MSEKGIKNKGGKGAKKAPKKHNYLLWIALVVLIVPVIFFVYIVIDTSGKTGEPVVGNRFQNALDPAITEQDLSTVKNNLQIANAVKTEVVLKSATLRVYVQLPDQTSSDDVHAVVEQAYEMVTNTLSVDTYFTNGANDRKMYDLEVHVYNFTPGEPSSDWNVYVTKSKNAAAKESIVDVLTSPKNQDVANSLLYPETVGQGEPAIAAGN